MKPGDKVAWTSRFGNPMEGVVVKVDPRRPLRKAGVRLGSWTNNFYRRACRVSFNHPTGRKRPGVQWMNASKLHQQSPAERDPEEQGAERDCGTPGATTDGEHWTKPAE